MIQKLLIQIAILLFKKHLLPIINKKIDKEIQDMEQKIVDSDYNEIINHNSDITEHVKVMLDNVLNKWEL